VRGNGPTASEDALGREKEEEIRGKVRGAVTAPESAKKSAASVGPAGKIRAAWQRISSREKREEGGELGLQEGGVDVAVAA
jgi:hypothetical protein